MPTHWDIDSVTTSLIDLFLVNESPTFAQSGQVQVPFLHYYRALIYISLPLSPQRVDKYIEFRDFDIV